MVSRSKQHCFSIIIAMLNIMYIHTNTCTCVYVFLSVEFSIFFLEDDLILGYFPWNQILYIFLLASRLQIIRLFIAEESCLLFPAMSDWAL